MAVPARPDDPSWRRNGHLFDNIPHAVQGYVREQIQVPEIHVLSLFPNEKLSIADFVYGTHIPPVNKKGHKIPEDYLFFRVEMPSDDVTVLKTLCVPPTGIVAQLMDQSKQAWLDGSMSIQLPGESIYVPLWAPAFWTRIYFDFLPSFTAWRKALEWLKREELIPFEDQVRATLKSLSTIPWRGNIYAALPGKTAFAMSSLQLYLSRAWLTDSQIDQMVYLLEREARESHPSPNIHFIDTVLARKILQLYSTEREGTYIYEPSGPEYWQVFGSKLTSASRIGGIFHINNNHWVAAAIDAEIEELAYGDPAGHLPNVNIQGALRWYASKHISSLKDEGQLDVTTLPCAPQDLSDDWWSCGILSYNALAHHFTRQPLLTQTDNPTFNDLARMVVLRKLIMRHSETVINALPLC